MDASNLIVVGVSHHVTPLELRERLAVSAREIPDALSRLKSEFGAAEAAILSTCNRVEIYIASHRPAEAFEQVMGYFSHRSQVDAGQLKAYLYELRGSEAIKHLFRVSAGADSMVLGESEIGAQVKQAYQVALSCEATGPILNTLFQKALHAAKIIRSTTCIAQGRTSIGSLVVALAEKEASRPLSDCRALLWGTGKAAEMTAKHLKKAGVSDLAVVGRTPAKAQELALLCEGGWVSWEQALTHLASADIAVICTQAPHYILDEGDLEPILAGRKSPLLIVDLAVPRNVSPSLASNPKIRLYNVDNLKVLARKALAQREQGQRSAESILHDQAEHVMRKWAGSPSSEPKGARFSRPALQPAAQSSVESIARCPFAWMPKPHVQPT